MKRVKILVASVLFCAMGYVGYTTHEKMIMSEAEKFMQANVEALTQDEGGTSGWLHCRCHNDGHCYAGNQISFRPACIKLYGSTDCDVYRANCPSA